jgi:hypothetical protein
MHALIFPTAIRIDTQNSSYSFTSFRSRSNTLDYLSRLLDNYKKLAASQLIENNENDRPSIECDSAEQAGKCSTNNADDNNNDLQLANKQRKSQENLNEFISENKNNEKKDINNDNDDDDDDDDDDINDDDEEEDDDDESLNEHDITNELLSIHIKKNAKSNNKPLECINLKNKFSNSSYQNRSYYTGTYMSNNCFSFYHKQNNLV